MTKSNHHTHPSSHARAINTIARRCLGFTLTLAALAAAPAMLSHARSNQAAALATLPEGPLGTMQQQIATPQAPAKASQNIHEYMSSVKTTLNHNKIEANLVRSGEVVQAVLPCEKLFAANTTDIKGSGMAYLKFFNSLLKYPDMYKVVVAVHSDDTGEDNYRQSLTDKRADAIRRYMCKASDTPGTNLFCYGISDASPLAPDNRSLANRERNRRVEIYIVPGEQMVSLASSGKLRFK